MQHNLARGAFLASSLALVFALGACGDHVDDSAQANHPSVEIDRQGQIGARNDAADSLHNPATAAIGGPATPDSGVEADARIATDVHQVLAADADLSAMKIDVSSQDGAVTLRGRAPDPAARDRATTLARNVKDVKSVENQLTLG